MKKFSEKVQRLSQRAAEIKHAIESVPPKIVEIRNSVTAATGQVQKLRADILSSVATLRAETDAQLITALREIDAGADVIEEAGCHLAGIDLDLGPARKVRVHLGWREDIDAEHVKELLQANAGRPTLAALLSALIKADELSEQVELEHLRHATITVEIGLVPSVRIGWRDESAAPAAATPMFAAVMPSVPIGPGSATTPNFVQSSYFAPKETAAAPEAIAAPGNVVAAQAVKEKAPVASDTSVPADFAAKWRTSSLERFKKMPDLTKR